EVVRWMFRHFANSADSLGDVARKLREKGAPPPPARRKKDGSAWGGEWTRFGVWTVLRNPAYLGRLVWNARRRGKYSRVCRREIAPVKGRRRSQGPQKNDPDDVRVGEGAPPPL